MTPVYKATHSILTIVIAKSGRGKSTALRNLPPEETFLVNVIGKTLPFPSAAKYTEGTNLLTDASATNIISTMQKVSRNEQFKYLVLDDVQYIMATEFMNKALVKGYDKFTQMAKNIWDILLLGSKLRGDLKVFALTHEDDSGNERKMKTLGKLLDEKLTPEGLATIVLFGDVATLDEGMRQYYFLTQSDGTANAKSPMGMFPSQIPNDLKLVADRIDEYYGENLTIEQSKLEDLTSIGISPKRR